MPALAVAAGFRVVEDKVHHRRRRNGLSKSSLGEFLFLPIIDSSPCDRYGSGAAAFGREMYTSRGKSAWAKR
jgi:hypothetical protein